MANPAVVQVAGGASTANSFTVSFGSARTAGNLLVAFVCEGTQSIKFYTGSDSITSSGWTLYGSLISDPTNGVSAAAYYRTADNTGADNPTITVPDNQPCAVSIWEVSNAGSIDTATGTVLSFSGNITLAGSNELVLGAHIGSSTLTVPSGWTSDGGVSGTTGLSRGHFLETGSGLKSYSFSVGGSSYGAVLLAIKPQGNNINGSVMASLGGFAAAKDTKGASSGLWVPFSGLALARDAKGAISSIDAPAAASAQDLGTQGGTTYGSAAVGLGLSAATKTTKGGQSSVGGPVAASVGAKATKASTGSSTAPVGGAATAKATKATTTRVQATLAAAGLALIGKGMVTRAWSTVSGWFAPRTGVPDPVLVFPLRAVPSDTGLTRALPATTGLTKAVPVNSGSTTVSHT